MPKEKEIRSIDYRVSVGEDSRTVEGYALLFNADSQPMGWSGDWVERIAPGALEGVLEKSDILCVLNHDESRGVLARWRQGSGSLTLEVDDKGLRYRFEAPNTVLGDELLEGIRRGDISGSSFAFTVEDEEWVKRGNDSYERIIKRFSQLFDVSPVYRPAYEDTTVAVRSLTEMEAREKREFLKTYYEQIENKF